MYLKQSGVVHCPTAEFPDKSSFFYCNHKLRQAYRQLWKPFTEHDIEASLRQGSFLPVFVILLLVVCVFENTLLLSM